jgi:hypothetical protein
MLGHPKLEVSVASGEVEVVEVVIAVGKGIAAKGCGGSKGEGGRQNEKEDAEDDVSRSESWCG